MDRFDGERWHEVDNIDCEKLIEEQVDYDRSVLDGKNLNVGRSTACYINDFGSPPWRGELN